MAVTVTYNSATKGYDVAIVDGVDSAGARVQGTENLLLQLAIDRASANTARVSVLEKDLRAQTDRIGDVNSLLSTLLSVPSTVDAAKTGATLTGVNLDATQLATLRGMKDQSGAGLGTYITGSSPVTLAAGKSLNDLMTAVKSELNQATNLNQQTMINYQSQLNLRNQMVEWTANLITLLATAAAQTAANLR